MQKGSLKRHIKSVHEGIKPFKCHICQYKSALKSGLKRHIISVHEGKKQVHCTFCNIGLSTKQKLKHHNSKFHEGAKPFQCNTEMENTDLKKEPLDTEFLFVEVKEEKCGKLDLNYDDVL